MHYVNLKEFRAKHGKMKQAELAELFGIGQTDVSRLENAHKLLTDEQYLILCDKYGKEDVDAYVYERPISYPFNMNGIMELLRIQQNIIQSQQETIRRLTELLATPINTLK